MRVILIPTRDEYRDAHLDNELWWTESDYASFKKQAVLELRTVMTLLNVDCKAAMRVVYQTFNETGKLGQNGVAAGEFEVGEEDRINSKSSSIAYNSQRVRKMLTLV